MLKRMKLISKFALIAVPTIILVITLVFAISVMSNTVHDKMEKALYDEIYTASTNLINADRDFYQALNADITVADNRYTLPAETIDTLISDYNENIEQTQDRINTAGAAVKDNSELYDSITMEQLLLLNGKDASESGNHGAMTYRQLEESVLDDISEWLLIYDPKTDEGSFDEQVTEFDCVRTYLNSMQDLLDEYAVYKINALESWIDRILIVIDIIGGIVLLFAVVLLITVVGSILIGVKASRNNIINLAKGNLAIEPKEIRGKDEIADMSRASIELYNSYKGIVQLIKGTSDRINAVSLDLSRTASDVDLTTSEITLAIQAIAKSTTEQAGDTSEASEQTRRLGEIIVSSNDAAELLAQSGISIGNATNEGMLVVNKLLEDSEASSESFEEIFTSIDDMARNAEKIGEASELIASIAKQTNLLSLNASIEAARAGEAGKGFAVVADEIRELAGQSAECVRIIDSMLLELKTSVDKAVEKRITVREAVEAQAVSVKETGEKYRSIVSSVSEINNGVDTLKGLSLDMDDSCRVVVGAVNHLSDSAASCAANSEETSASTITVKEAMGNISDVSKHISNLSEELEKILVRFTL